MWLRLCSLNTKTSFWSLFWIGNPNPNTLLMFIKPVNYAVDFYTIVYLSERIDETEENKIFIIL